MLVESLPLFHGFVGIRALRCLGRGVVTAIMSVTILLSLAIEVRAAERWGQHRYVAVDGKDWVNDGSRQHPWRTIEYAASKALPGTTIHVLPGVYALSRIILTRSDGTPQARIRYVSEERWGAKLQTSASQVWLNSGAYVDIDGFDISSTTLSTYIGIHSQGSYDRILNNHIHNFGALPGSCPQGGGIVMGDLKTIGQEAHGNIVHDIGPPPGTCNLIHGIYVAIPHCKVTNNVVFGNSGTGMHLWGRPDHCLIANNTIFANGRGLVVGGDPNYGITDYTVVANNIVYQNPDLGIYETGLTGSNNRFVHNLVQGSKTNWSLKTGQQFGSIAADPQFVRYTGRLDGDYHLKRTSPGIGYGEAEFAPESDFASSPRRHPPDIGAYESQ
jgi:parallel beta-helix repeat protein